MLVFLQSLAKMTERVTDEIIQFDVYPAMWVLHLHGFACVSLACV